MQYSIRKHAPHLAEREDTPFLFLRIVIEQQIALVTNWMRVGFIHGVMNTDNTTISGETLDYGPAAFMNHYNPYQSYSFIDTEGRYAFQNQ
jgi:uncharacterized protein YdiU (UPF0061 family)